MVYLSGAPTVPSDKSQEALLVAKSWFDLISPDYYGYGRSDGFFSPKNCIQTAYDTLQTFRQQIPVISVYSPDELFLPCYDEIIILWASYGGWIATAMPKYDELIKEIVLLYPWFASEDTNTLWYPEEDDEMFLRQFLLGYKSLYRFEDIVSPFDGLISLWALNPRDDLSYLKDTKIFVWHGTADDVIRSGRSRQFVDNLRELNHDGQYHYAEYYGLDHGWLCKQVSLQWWLFRREQFEQQE